MKIKIDESRKEKIITYSLIGIIVVITYLILNNFNIITDFVDKFFNVLKPFIIGSVLAMILNPLMKFFENLFPNSMNFKLKRVLSTLVSVLILVLAVVAFLQTLIPQLFSSVSSLLFSLNEILIESDGDYAKTLVEHLNVSPEQSANIVNSINQGLDYLIKTVSNLAPQVLSYSISIVISIFHIIMGVIIAIYILIDKEKFKVQIRKVFHSIFNQSEERELEDIYHLIVRMFNGFLIGKTIDSVIIGIITFIVLSVFGIHYAFLISFIVGVTNIIPNFGPLFGAIPGFLILLILDPIESFYFLIIILAIQQLDGNIIGPYILGDSMGLPSFWILFAIILGGGFFGIFGMVLAVPTFAVLYSFFQKFIDRRLAKKQIDIQL
jgi:predicted PurR-regulated permease PerM